MRLLCWSIYLYMDAKHEPAGVYRAAAMVRVHPRHHRGPVLHRIHRLSRQECRHVLQQQHNGSNFP